MSVNPADFYAASQGQRAIEERRAAEVRRKLLKGAAQIDAAATPEETLMISQWLDGRHSQTESADEYHATAAGRDPDFG